MEILRRSGAVIETMSIDEAYLDFSAVVESLGAQPRASSNASANPGAPLSGADEALYAAVPLARELKGAILAERNLTASVGVASNKLLAKLASDFQKPNGLTLIPEQDKVAFLQPLPVRSLHGVGRVTEQVLNDAGIQTVGDLQNYTGDLRALVGSFAARLKAFSFGEDDRPLELGEEVKSISSEETFSQDTADRKVLKASLRNQAEDICARLKHRQLAAQTIQVKLRYGDFTTLTRQITVEEPITEASEFYRLACFLLAREQLVARPLRLLGLGASHLDLPASRQLPLF
jgi:DNA polymerase-4